MPKSQFHSQNAIPDKWSMLFAYQILKENISEAIDAELEKEEYNLI